ncbi:MAG: hypothetical protein V3S09_04240, partial [Candidatus Bathyarchaeia archaeon]
EKGEDKVGLVHTVNRECVSQRYIGIYGQPEAPEKGPLITHPEDYGSTARPKVLRPRFSN